ncbi:pantothenate transporter [Sporothrix schenckii 1099-18]|uniref:Pantothenate transporter n=1 Tax=Sporothrix schenckii 1099-18 TaxID=1397361 RepID=A0A0F2MPF1_SPOSC|nr:pantothenate transporter [Sporothrix schenckii 1099-18]KJR90046.1 pantothenate transporter [Sporothrix schenckii 1099-18]
MSGHEKAIEAFVLASPPASDSEAASDHSPNANSPDSPTLVNREWSTKASFWRWFHPNDGPAERRLVTKLDVSILAFACAGFWALYIDRGMYNNAYISGMKEDLQFYGNQYVQINSIFLIGYAVSIIPLTLINTRAPPQIVIPVCMAVWGLATSLGARAQSYGELAGYRFLVGLGEGAFFPSIHYVFGSWYRPDELARRSGLFYVAGSVGTISTGFLAGRIYADLDGALGHAAWRWMYLVGGVIALPIALFGILTFPGTPQHPNKRLFREDELALARARLAAMGRRSTRKASLVFSLSSVRRFVGRWHVWVLVPWSIVYQQGYLAMLQGTYTLWIKSVAGSHHYSTATVNNLTAVPPCAAIVAIVLFAWVADRFGVRARLPLFALAHTVAFLGLVAFVAYDHSPFAYKWFGVAVSNVENAMVPVMYSWANLICTDDAEERAFVLSAMLAFAMAFNSWVPILSMPTVEAPRYFKGYLVCLLMQPVALALAFLVDYLHRREVQKKARAAGDEAEGSA